MTSSKPEFPKPRPAPRMADVAKLAGVSVTTVSHVINKTRHVAPETSEVVLGAMREVNFYKNVHARHLVRGWSDTYGLIISDIENPFFPGVIKSFESTAAKQGFDVQLYATNYDPVRMENAVRRMIEIKVPGVAVITSQFDLTLAEELVAQQVAVVFLDSGRVQRLTSNIRVDYWKGTFQAIHYLRNLGHKDFAFIGGPQDRLSAVTYRKAFMAALQECGLTSVRFVEGNNKVDGGIAAIHTLLTQPNLPTAILCGNDLAAIGAINALAEVGMRVPEDISVIGSDDISFAALTRPALTTVKIPRDRLGELAFEALDKMVHSTRRQGEEHVIETELVIRQSTGPARTKDLPQPLSGTDTAQP